ncbi:MAG: hypothetical protein ABW007_20690, partial [Chitinophagaceae bacterium]
MITSIKKLSAIAGFALLMSSTIISCTKDDDKILEPGQVALFLPTAATASYSIVTPTTVYKIPVGLTAPVTDGKTKTVNVTASSSSGAVEGTHYTYTKTLTFAPGKITDTIIVTGIQSQYLAGRKDVIRFTFADAGDFSASLNSAFTLNVSGPCFEGDIVPNDFLGSYANTVETFGSGAPYGPYTTTVSSVTSTGPTTADITVTNIYDAGWNPVKFTLDWTDINNRKVTLVQQFGIADAGTINEDYAGEDVTVRPIPAGTTGTFSWCEDGITLKFQVGVVGLGYFGSPFYT